jgi:hypothetical protein
MDLLEIMTLTCVCLILKSSVFYFFSSKFCHQSPRMGRVWWPVVPATLEADDHLRPAWAVSARPYLKSKLETKGLGLWLKWWSTAYQARGPEFSQ